MLRSRVVGLLSGLGRIFLYISILELNIKHYNFRLNEANEYLHHNIISVKETFSESLVKIRHEDVTWRHVTLFLKYLPKNCWRHQKIGTMGQSLLIFRMRPHNTFPTRGQPLSYDKRFTSYRICTGYRFLSDFCRIFDDVITKNADIGKYNDVTIVVRMENKS